MKLLLPLTVAFLLAAAPAGAALPLQEAETSAIVAHWTPTSARGARVLARVDAMARETVRVNDLTGSRVYSCVRHARYRWECIVRYFAGATAVDKRYVTARWLTRARRNGRWVGPWRPTKGIAVLPAEEATRSQVAGSDHELRGEVIDPVIEPHAVDLGVQ